MFCGSCGKQVPDGTVFCPNCGYELKNSVVSSQSSKNGGTVVIADSKSRINTDSVRFVPGELPVKPEIPVSIPVENNNNKLVKILVIVAAVLAAIVALAIIIIPKLNEKPDVLVYLKNNTLYLSDIDNSANDSLGEIQEDGYEWQYEHEIYISDDEKYILFGLEKNGNDSVDLYFSKEGGKAHLIRENIEEYYISKGKAIYRDEDSLYAYDFSDKEEEEITDNIIDCIAGKESRKIAYIDNDDTLYIASDDNDDREEIASGVSKIIGCSKNMKHIVYSKDTSLYVCTAGEKPELISEDFDSDKVVLSEGEKLNICYQSPARSSAYMFIDDDLSSDESQDVRQKLQFTEVFKNGEFTSLNIYKKELDKDSTGSASSVTGGAGLADTFSYNISGDDMICVMCFVKFDDIPKIKLSEFADEYGTDFDEYDVEDLIYSSIEDDWKWLISRKGVTNDLDSLKGEVVSVASDSKKPDYCYVCLDKGNNKFEIGQINLRGKKTGEYETLYSGGQALWYADNGNVVYIDKSGNLCVNDTKIESDIDSVEILK